MTPEEEFFGPDPSSRLDFPSYLPPLPREFPVCHPSWGCVFFSEITQYSVHKSDLTQHAQVQVEQKFFAKSFCKFEMCTQFLNNCNVTLTVSHPKKIQGVAIIFKHFYEKFFFSRAFQAPLKSNIKFQPEGFSRTSRSSTNHANRSKTKTKTRVIA